MWPELKTVSSRSRNPFYITSDEADELNLKIFPHWMKKSVFEVTRARNYEGQFHGPVVVDYPDEIKLFQNLVFFLTSKLLCISHTIPDFTKAVNMGLRGMISKLSRRSATRRSVEDRVLLGSGRGADRDYCVRQEAGPGSRKHGCIREHLRGKGLSQGNRHYFTAKCRKQGPGVFVRPLPRSGSAGPQFTSKIRTWA